MATTEQREALLARPCPWCHASVGEPCHVPQAAKMDTEGGRRRRSGLRLITTLDGGAHDARWRAALGGTAAVIAAAVPRAERVPVAAGDRPW